jgi:hypothetical protein
LAEKSESGGNGRKENFEGKGIGKRANPKEREFQRTFQPKEFDREQRPFEGLGSEGRIIARLLRLFPTNKRLQTVLNVVTASHFFRGGGGGGSGGSSSIRPTAAAGVMGEGET